MTRTLGRSADGLLVNLEAHPEARSKHLADTRQLKNPR